MAELNNEVVGLTTNGVDEDACDDMFGRIPDKDVNVIGDKSAASAIDGEHGMAVLNDISRTATGDESGMECVVDEGRSSVDASHNSSSCSVDGDAEGMEFKRRVCPVGELDNGGENWVHGGAAERNED